MSSNIERFCVSWDSVLSTLEVPFRKRSTGVLVALCPFHNERTPSTHFWPSGNFRCHGCHAGGGVVDFIQQLLKTDDVYWTLRNSTYYKIGYLTFEVLYEPEDRCS